MIDSYEELLGRAVEIENKSRTTKSGKPEAVAAAAYTVLINIYSY